jgi:hypothetical protein
MGGLFRESRKFAKLSLYSASYRKSFRLHFAEFVWKGILLETLSTNHKTAFQAGYQQQ